MPMMMKKQKPKKQKPKKKMEKKKTSRPMDLKVILFENLIIKKIDWS